FYKEVSAELSVETIYDRGRSAFTTQVFFDVKKNRIYDVGASFATDAPAKPGIHTHPNAGVTSFYWTKHPLNGISSDRGWESISSNWGPTKHAGDFPGRHRNNNIRNVIVDRQFLYLTSKDGSYIIIRNPYYNKK